jgi:hypothetical protein
MGSLAWRIIIAALIAGLVAAVSTPAAAQWGTWPAAGDDSGFKSGSFGSSSDFRPEWPDFGPLPVAGPNPTGAAELIEIPKASHKNKKPNVLILPRVVPSEGLTRTAA